MFSTRTSRARRIVRERESEVHQRSSGPEVRFVVSGDVPAPLPGYTDPTGVLVPSPGLMRVRGQQRPQDQGVWWQLDHSEV